MRRQHGMSWRSLSPLCLCDRKTKGRVWGGLVFFFRHLSLEFRREGASIDQWDHVKPWHHLWDRYVYVRWIGVLIISGLIESCKWNNYKKSNGNLYHFTLPKKIQANLPQILHKNTPRRKKQPNKNKCLWKTLVKKCSRKDRGFTPPSPDMKKDGGFFGNAWRQGTRACNSVCILPTWKGRLTSAVSMTIWRFILLYIRFLQEVQKLPVPTYVARKAVYLLLHFPLN